MYSHRMVQREHIGVKISFNNGPYCLMCIIINSLWSYVHAWSNSVSLPENYLSLAIGQLASDAQHYLSLN